MAAVETMTAQVTCDWNNDCSSTVYRTRMGIQRIRRTARDSFDWSIIDGKDICPTHKSQALRAKQKREEQNATN